MNLLVTICARAGSKGVKNKNIKIFNGKPLVYYTLHAYELFCMQNQDNFNKLDLALNTDSHELVEQVNTVKIPYTHVLRKENLAGDTVGKVDVIRDTIKEMENSNGYKYDYIIDLDLTSPLRKDDDIKGVFNKLLENEEAEVAFSVVPARRLPFFNMVKEEENGFYSLVIESDYVTRQQAPKCYDMNASIYAYKREFLLNEKTNKVLDGKAVIYEMTDTGIIDIDSEGDFELMQVIAEHFEEGIL